MCIQITQQILPLGHENESKLRGGYWLSGIVPSFEKGCRQDDCLYIDKMPWHYRVIDGCRVFESLQWMAEPLDQKAWIALCAPCSVGAQTSSISSMAIHSSFDLPPSIIYVAFSFENCLRLPSARAYRDSELTSDVENRLFVLRGLWPLALVLTRKTPFMEPLRAGVTRARSSQPTDRGG